MKKTAHRLPRGRAWTLLVLIVVLLAAHGVVLYYVSSHVVLSAAVLWGAIILLLIKHVGLLGPVFALFRRRRSGNRP